MRQIFSLTFRDLLILFLEQIKYGFFSLKNQMAEETERERRIFQLQMCEVSSWCSNIHFIFSYLIHNAFIGDLQMEGAVLSLEYIINV